MSSSLGRLEGIDLPVSFFGGGIFLIFADLVARSILPSGEILPVGIVTALVGVPFFIILLRRTNYKFS